MMKLLFCVRTEFSFGWNIRTSFVSCQLVGLVDSGRCDGSVHLVVSFAWIYECAAWFQRWGLCHDLIFLSSSVEQPVIGNPLWKGTKMGALCCCARTDDFEEYGLPSNSIYRHCICLRFFLNQLLTGVYRSPSFQISNGLLFHAANVDRNVVFLSLCMILYSTFHH